MERPQTPQRTAKKRRKFYTGLCEKIGKLFEPIRVFNVLLKTLWGKLKRS